MRERLASLVLLLVMAGGAFAGIPLHFGEPSACSMGEEMGGMECCMMALLQSQTPEVAAAKLCCAINCSQGGTTSPPGGFRVTRPSLSDVSPHPASAEPSPHVELLRRRFDRDHGPPLYSEPAYIRHLALLI